MITFQTNIWEKDWQFVLEGNYLQKVIKRCNTDFEQKYVIVNNVNDRQKVESQLQNKVSDGVIDNYFFVDDYVQEVLTEFSLNKELFNGGYYISISELVGIHICQSAYLLYFKGDSFLASNNSKWISQAIELLEKRKDIFVANATWNKRFKEAKRESDGELNDFFIGYGFSDQCFLARTGDLKKNIYHEKNSASERYPKDWGDSFEKRVDSHMRNHQLKRITHKKNYYFHKNYTNSLKIRNSNFLRKLYVLRRLLF